MQITQENLHLKQSHLQVPFAIEENIHWFRGLGRGRLRGPGLTTAQREQDAVKKHRKGSQRALAVTLFLPSVTLDKLPNFSEHNSSSLELHKGTLRKRCIFKKKAL